MGGMLVLLLLLLDAYERSFEVEPEDSERYLEFFANLSNIEDLLLEVLIGDGGLTDEVFFKLIGASDLPNVERVWILHQYIDALKEACSHVEEVGLDTEDISRIRNFIANIESKIQVVTNKKKNLKGIKEIHSICTVAEKVVSDVVIFKGEEGSMKAISIQG
jgi:hypothetical protein